MIGPHAYFHSKKNSMKKISVVQKTVPIAGVARLLDSNISYFTLWLLNKACNQPLQASFHCLAYHGNNDCEEGCSLYQCC